MNNTQADNAKDLDIAMLMYNLIEYCDNCSKTSGSLYQFYRDETNDDDITDSVLFKFKSKFLNNTDKEDIINVKVAVQLKYLSNFWKTLEMSLINCEMNVILFWSENCVTSEGDRKIT